MYAAAQRSDSECGLEAVIKIVLYSAAAPFFISTALVIWGLRVVNDRAPKG
jgi:hypothetical protein